jgi:hypothetical protein
MNTIRTVILGAALLLAVSQAMAQGAQPRDRELGARGGFLAQADFDYGGDELLAIEFEDGESQEVRAGQGFGLSVGGYFRPLESSSLEIQASVGYKFATTAASNADIHVSRTLLQLGAFHRWPNGFYLGGGVMNHLGPKLNGDGFFEDIDFDDATGFNAEIGWRWIALHYTKIEYSSEFYEDVDASHVGIRFTYRWGQRWF